MKKLNTWVNSRPMMVVAVVVGTLLFLSMISETYYMFTDGAFKIFHYWKTQERVPGIVIAINLTVMWAVGLVTLIFVVLKKIRRKARKHENK